MSKINNDAYDFTSNLNFPRNSNDKFKTFDTFAVRQEIEKQVFFNFVQKLFRKVKKKARKCFLLKKFY